VVKREPSEPEPEKVYIERMRHREAEAAGFRAGAEQIANARLIVGLGAMVLAWLAWRGTVAPFWIALPVVVFLALVFRHEAIRRALAHAERGAEHYRRGLERLAGRWAGKGEPGLRFLDPAHPYAADLDLFGRGSLFDLLSTPRTQTGEETLAAWLTAAATPVVIGARQAAVTELTPALDLREDLAVLGPEVRQGVHPLSLAEWGAAPPVFDNRRPLWIAAITLAALGAITGIGWAKLGFGPWPFLAIIAVKMLFERRIKARVEDVLHAAERAGAELDLLASLLARLERERPASPRLDELRAAIETRGVPASKRIRRLDQLIELKDSQHNLFFAPIAFVLVWPVLVALAIESWRAAQGPAVRGWLAAVGEIEALGAFATLAYENPADVFPEMVGAEGGPVFAAQGLGHPFIPQSGLVRNDLRLDAGTRLIVVSGSNMSGKSTLLRAAGTNAVLALAGATVRAQSLRLTPLAVGASLSRRDSLTAGVSHFYAEIEHLATIDRLSAGGLPLFFLLDELLHGTNSHDRRIGAEAIVKRYVGRGGIGLITTHDLSLTEIVEAITPSGTNMHFADEMDGGRMIFDYRLRPGVVTRGNALALMRAVGLEV
jgi:MutS domain V